MPGLTSAYAGSRSPVDPLSSLALVALLVGMAVALTQRVWPVALLCLGLFMALLAEAGVIVT